MPEGPGMAKMLSKMPAFMRKMMMARKLDSFMNMEKDQRINNIFKMLGQISQLDPNGAQNMMVSRMEIVQGMDPEKAKMVTMAFQVAFSTLPPSVQAKMRMLMEKTSGKILEQGKEWYEFDS
jgi:hypothetical protein